MTREQGPACDVVGEACRSPGARPLLLRHLGLRPVGGVERHLEVDESVLRQRELELGSSDQQLCPGDAAYLGEQHAEPSLVVGRRLVTVDGE